MTLDKPENRVELKPETEKIKGEEWQIWDTTLVLIKKAADTGFHVFIMAVRRGYHNLRQYHPKVVEPLF
ncbi:hypothetical protein [Enterobacter sp.]|uniref:hypothetical protein n=1 Tax=Enterobacter sp. TaxID=42895 RepID=UPI00296E3181|nr:hypothetical protein [Enterobacter sp.]